MERERKNEIIEKLSLSSSVLFAVMNGNFSESIVIDNLKPAKLMGLESQGMLLAASDEEGNLSLLTVDKDIKEGSTIS